MNKQFLLAAYVEEFCTQMAATFRAYRDEIDTLLITKDDGREELLYVLLAQKMAIKTEEEHIPLVRQFVSVICNSTYLHDEPEDNDWEQYELFKEVE